MNDLDTLVHSAVADFDAAATPADLENAKARFLGKTGRVTEALKGLGALAPDEKKARGAEINQVKQRIEAALSARRQGLADGELQAQLKAEALDVTLPGRRRGDGGLHQGVEVVHGGAEAARGMRIGEERGRNGKRPPRR